MVVAGLAAVNIRGLSRSAAINVTLALIDIATQAAIIVLGTVLVLDPARLVDQVHLGSVPTWGDLVFAVSISMVAYTGIETIANMAEEEKDPGRDVPRAANAVVGAVLLIYLGITVVALSALPVHQVHGEFTTQLGTTFQSDPVLGIVSSLNLGAIESAAKDYVGLLAATILLIATNAGLIGISRLSWSLAEHRQLPMRFANLYGKQRTPAFTIVVFSALAVVLILPGSATFLGNLYSFGALAAFTIAHASVIALRLRRPEQERPYRAPWNVRIGGRPVPLTAVIGGIGTFAAWVSLLVLHAAARIIGPLWMLVGLGLYVLYRRHQGLGLGELSRRGLDRPGRMPRFTREWRRPVARRMRRAS